MRWQSLKGHGGDVVYVRVFGIGHCGLQSNSGRIPLRLASHGDDLQLSTSYAQCADNGSGRKTNQHVAECGEDHECVDSRAR
jgi:hypothetical protein